MVSPSLLEWQSLNFVGSLEKGVLDKVISREYFNTLNSTHDCRNPVY
jgi:hypothetical protein